MRVDMLDLCMFTSLFGVGQEKRNSCKRHKFPGAINLCYFLRIVCELYYGGNRFFRTIMSEGRNYTILPASAVNPRNVSSEPFAHPPPFMPTV